MSGPVDLANQRKIIILTGERTEFLLEHGKELALEMEANRRQFEDAQSIMNRAPAFKQDSNRISGQNGVLKEPHRNLLFDAARFNGAQVATSPKSTRAETLWIRMRNSPD